MALEFEFRKEKIVLDAKFFMFKEFSDIWKYDKTKDKLKANSLLYFVYLLCDIGVDNPLKDTDPDKREVEAKFKAFHDKNHSFIDKEYELLEKATKIYILINTTPEERLLTAFDEKAEQLASVLETTAPETQTNEDNGVVTFVSNSKLITDSLTKLSSIRKYRATIVAAIKNEAMSEKVRGQIALSPLIRGLLIPPR